MLPLTVGLLLRLAILLQDWAGQFFLAKAQSRQDRT